MPCITCTSTLVQWRVRSLTLKLSLSCARTRARSLSLSLCVSLPLLSLPFCPSLSLFPATALASHSLSSRLCLACDRSLVRARTHTHTYCGAVGLRARAPFRSKLIFIHQRKGSDFLIQSQNQSRFSSMRTSTREKKGRRTLFNIAGTGAFFFSCL